MKRRPLALLTLLVSLGTGCSHGAAMTAGIGPLASIDGGAGVIATLEVSRIQHTEPSQSRYREGPGNMLGFARSAQAAGGWESVGGGYGGAAVAFDYLPYLGSWGFVNLGGGVGLDLQGGPALSVVAPRLGFAITPWTLGTGQWGLGARLHCQFATGGPNLCGPVLTATQLWVD